MRHGIGALEPVAGDIAESLGPAQHRRQRWHPGELRLVGGRASAGQRVQALSQRRRGLLVLAHPRPPSVPSWVLRRLAVAELRGHLIHPAPALGMVEAHYLVEGPVDMASQVGHLVVNPFHGVAGYPPSGGTSTVCSPPHCGQVTASSDGARPLIRL